MRVSNIQVNLKRDKIVLKIAEEAEYEQVVYELKKKLPDLKKFYNNEKTPILVTGKVLKNKEMDEIKQIIQEVIEVEIDFEIPKTLGLHSIKRTFNKNTEISETKYYRGSLRCGQRMEAEGSLVVLGDVNSGAEVMAADNIVVLGALRGLAHAGAKGNKDAIISAGLIDTVQMRIADIVKEINRDEETLHKMAYCYVEDGKIIID